MGRYALRDEIARLDPVTDHAHIATLLATREYPWDITQALSFALFRTYAVPSIGRLLHETGELTERTQKRYDDTVLVLDAILEHGLASTEGRSAVRRMNQMHRAHGIPDDDLRYVLATFVVSPVRWVDAFGWRPYTPGERTATATYYRQLGRRMGITQIPSTYAAFETLMDDYEQQHFAFDDGARAVADATLDLLGTLRPQPVGAPGGVATACVLAHGRPPPRRVRLPAPGARRPGDVPVRAGQPGTAGPAAPAAREADLRTRESHRPQLPAGLPRRGPRHLPAGRLRDGMSGAAVAPRA